MSAKPPVLQAEIRALTEARLTFGKRGGAVATAEALAFALDHARARAAVEAELDIPRLVAALDRIGLAHRVVTSAAGDRATFIRRPDLGRRLAPAEAAALADAGGCDVALMLGDGLSATAVALNGVAFPVGAGRPAGRDGPAPVARHPCAAGAGGLGRRHRTGLGGHDRGDGAWRKARLVCSRQSRRLHHPLAPRSGTADSARNCISTSGLPGCR